MYKVLVIEDEALFRKVLRKIVETMENYQVIGELQDGDDAVALCEREKPDFVCIDLALPGENGIYVGQKLKKRWPEMKIFILSASRNFQVIRDVMDAGLDAYLCKPYHAEEVKRAFQRHQDVIIKHNEEGDAFTESIRKRNIMDTFLLCRKLTADIFSLHYKEQERYEELQKITQYTVDYMGTLTAAKRENYEKKYALVPDAQKFPCIAEAFLHFLMKDVYRLQILSKYPQFNVILTHIHHNVDKGITLNEIADLCAMSVGYITRIFKRYYGIGVVDYAHLIKILWAKLYLSCTELSISDISYNLGYNDPGYFSKVFKKYEGMTPTCYKRSYDCQGYNINGNFKSLLK